VPVSLQDVQQVVWIDYVCAAIDCRVGSETGIAAAAPKMLAARKRKIAENLAPHLQPGESVAVVVMTQTGATASDTAVLAAGQSGAAGFVHALVATDRRLLAVPVPVWTGIGDPVVDVPLAEADLQRQGRRLVLAGTDHNLLFFAGGDAKRLMAAVEAARPGPARPGPSPTQ
jgi:hypothetical protein